MGHMVKYPDRRDGSTLFDFYGNIIPGGGGGGWPSENGSGPGNLVAETAVDDTVGYQFTDQGSGGILLNTTGGGEVVIAGYNGGDVNVGVGAFSGSGGTLFLTAGDTSNGINMYTTGGVIDIATGAGDLTIEATAPGTGGVRIQTDGGGGTTGISLTTQVSDTVGIAITDNSTSGIVVSNTAVGGFVSLLADDVAITASVAGSGGIAIENQGSGGVDITNNSGAGSGIVLNDASAHGISLQAQGTGGILIETTGTDETTGIALTTNADDSGGISLTDNGSAGIKLTGNLGFYGTTPIGKPAVSGSLSTVVDPAAKAVLTSIITALVNLGLVTNSTT